MNYTRITWANNSTPAIDADNLNRIEGGIEKAYELINKCTMIKTGYYMGTGTFGKDNPTVIPTSAMFDDNTNEIDFVPQIIIISRNSEGGIPSSFPWIRGAEFGVTEHIQNLWHSVRITWADDSVSWFSDESASAQLNISGVEYKIAILGTKE